MAIEAAKAGKHVAVEKPLAISVKEADEMIGAVGKLGVQDIYLENLCFAPSYTTAKRIVEVGGVGDVYFCKAREACDLMVGSEAEHAMIQRKGHWDWLFNPVQSGGGCLINMGCHPIQYIRYLYNNIRVKKVFAEITEQVGSPKPKGIEDAVLLVMKFEDERVGTIEASYYADGGQSDKAEIYGNKGTILIDLYTRNPITVNSHLGYSFQQSAFLPPSENKGWTFPVPDENYSLGYYHELRHFLQSILQDRRPTVNFDDGRATLEIIEAGYKSHNTGQAVALPAS